MEPCRICGEIATVNTTGRTSNGYELHRCGACRAVLVKDRPAPEEVARVYDELFREGDYAMHRREFDALRAGGGKLSLFRQYAVRRIERLTPGRRMIEIGGGSGAFGLLAQTRGFQYKDYDISSAAVGFARELGLDAERLDPSGKLELAPASADVVVMWEVVEHLWEVHDSLRAIKRALAPGGVFIFSTPNLAYQSELEKNGLLSSPPLHVNFFDEASLRFTLRSAGLVDPDVRSKRFYRPALNAADVKRSLRWALGIDPPMTLLGTARRTA